MALLTLAALAVPSVASANWTHKGQGELKTNVSLGLKGDVTLSTSAGNVVCAAELGTTLTGSSTSGHVNSFTVSKPSECDLTGSLATICGTKGVTKVEKTGTWAMTADETAITVSEVDIHYTLGGCLIPGFRVKGSFTATPDKANAISSATLSGSQTLYNALGESVGSGELKATLAASPAGTYGLKTAPTVKTIWLKHNKHLTEDEELALAGQFTVSGSLGSITCTISAKANLFSEEVEEGEPEGELESFTVSNPAACDLTGTLKEACGTKGVTGVEKTGTWNLTATEEDIAASGLSLDYKFSGCAIPSLRFDGDATVEVNYVTGIEETTFSGTLTTYNGAEEEIGSAEVGGAQTASPSGTFALEAEHATPSCPEGPEGEGSGTWTHEGIPLFKPGCIELTGPFSFGPTNNFSSIEGNVNMALSMQPGGGGSIVSFHWSGCKGTGFLAGTTCTPTATSPEWSVEATSNGTFLVTFSMHLLFWAGPHTGTPVTTLSIPGSFIAVPDNMESISLVALEAGPEFIVGGVPWKLQGELEVSPPETFGISE